MRNALVAAAVLAAAALAAGVLGPDPAPPPAEEVEVEPMAPAVLLVVDSGDPYALQVADHARLALARVRVPHREHDVAGDAPLPALDGYGAVLTAAERLHRIADADADRLDAYVRGGGGLAVLYRGWNERLAGLVGAVGAENPAYVGAAEALTFTTPLMPGGEDLRLQPSESSPLDLAAAPECDVFAVREAAGGARPPAAWTCARGAGRVAFWNTTLLSEKPYRGHLLQTLALVYPDHVRPVARWVVVHLDDFPSPASNAELDPVWTASGQTPAQFYAERWYPDMVALADRAGLRYTSTVIYAYNGQTEPPFRFVEWINGRVEVGGRAVPYSPWVMALDARRSEQALHGYNHQSLTQALWPSRTRMVEALEAARTRWQAEDFAPLPRTYVPPMNWVDSVGVSAVHEAFPEVETVAGLYYGPFETGQGREFGPEPWAPELYALPRNTAGYILNDPNRLRTLSLLQSIGAWSHFVHPDEVYPNADREETYRANGLPNPSSVGWGGERGMYAEFGRWVGFVQTHYPWLDALPAAEAADRMRTFDRLRLAWHATPAEGVGSRRRSPPGQAAGPARGKGPGAVDDEGGAVAQATPPAPGGAGRRLDVALSQAGQTVLAWSRTDEGLVRVDGGRVVDMWRGPLLTQYVVEATGHALALHFAPITSSDA